MFNQAGGFNTLRSTVEVVNPATGARNRLELKATLFNGAQDKPFLNSSAGAIFKARYAEISLIVDGGDFDVTLLEESVFQLFTLTGSVPLITKTNLSGIVYTDNKIVISISAAELYMSGRHYFEIAVVKETRATLLSGYITIVNSRID